MVQHHTALCGTACQVCACPVMARPAPCAATLEHIDAPMEHKDAPTPSVRYAVLAGASFVFRIIIIMQHPLHEL